jgi:hypothetical protein
MIRVVRCVPGLLLLCSLAPAYGQLPATRLDGLYPPGGQVGQAVDVTISGADLDDVTELIFSDKGITAKLKMAEPTVVDERPQPIENQFVVSIAANVTPGIYDVRCRGKYGLSGQRKFSISATEATVETEPNNDAESSTLVSALPGVIYGQLNGAADVDWIRFPGTAGQRILIDCMAQRIDSPATTTISLYTIDGNLITDSRKGLTGDALIDTNLPSTGEYLVRIQESLYRGGVQYVYRLVLGEAPVIDCIFPPAGAAGSNDEYTIFGRNLPGGSPAPITRFGQKLEQLKVRIPIPSDIEDKLIFSDALFPHRAGLDGLEYRVDGPDGKSNPILLTVATAPKIFEQDNNDTPETAQSLTLPCEVMGRFFPQRDADWYTFEAKKDDEYWLEVYSHRLGLSTDATILVQRVEKQESGEEKITQMAGVDDVNQRDGGFEFDQRTHDPYYHFTAPADGTYRLLVRESHSSVVSDPQLMYRLAVRKAQPDFRLAAVPMDSSGALFLRQNGREAVNVTVFRQDGFEDEIHISVAGLPTGVTAEAITIGPGCNRATVILTAAADAAATEGQIEIVGKSKIGDREVSRRARTGHPLAAVPFAQPTNRNQASVPSKLTSNMPIVVTAGEKERVVITLPDAAKKIETARGGIVKVKYAVTRDGDAGGNVVGYPFGGPTTMQIRQTNMGANKAGEFELRFPGNMPAGTYSMNLVATVQGMKYVRNPEAVEVSKKRQERINNMLAEAKKTTQASQQAVQKMQNTLNQLNTQLTQAKTAQTNSARALQTAVANEKKASDAVAAIQKQLVAKPEDEALKKQLAAAEQKVVEENKKTQAAKTAADEAANKLGNVTAEQKAATEAKTAADTALAVAQQRERDITQQKTLTDTKHRQLEQAARQRNINHITYSQPVTIQVAEYPVEFADLAKTTLKQGETKELPVKLTRLFGFDQTVAGQVRLPGGVSGLQIQNISVPNGKQDAMIKITAQANATPGEHQITLAVTLTFNGQRLTFDQPFTVTVEKVDPEKK